MKKRLLRIATILILLVMLIPVYREMDDGGSREYSAILYSVTQRHAMSREEGDVGYLTGTEIRLLGFKVYSSVQFVPSVGE